MEIYLPVLKAFLLLNLSQAISKQGWGFTRSHKSFQFASRRMSRKNRHDIPEGTFYQLKQKWNPSHLGNRKWAEGVTGSQRVWGRGRCLILTTGPSSTSLSLHMKRKEEQGTQNERSPQRSRADFLHFVSQQVAFQQ